jgi:CO/xanthine dehydrogenase Mo-binding subunit
LSCRQLHSFTLFATGRNRVGKVATSYSSSWFGSGGGTYSQGGALFEAIDFANGKILNPRFSDYRVPRFGDVPVMETVLLDRKDLASAGAGETPIVAVAPAVGNAIFQATGVRLRSLPMVPKGLKKP